MKPRLEEPNDTTEMWRAVHQDQARHRAAKRERLATGIQGLAAKGYTVKTITEFQFRIDGTLDLYPTRKRYHHLKTQARGSWGGESALEICRRLLP